jgi:hypothetical protein
MAKFHAILFGNISGALDDLTPIPETEMACAATPRHFRSSATS